MYSYRGIGNYKIKEDKYGGPQLLRQIQKRNQQHISKILRQIFKFVTTNLKSKKAMANIKKSPQT